MRWVVDKKVGSILIVLAIWGAYAGSLGNDFTYDTWGIVLDNPLVRHGDWGAILTTSYWWGPTGEMDSLYRPLTIASFAVNYQWAGPSPWSFHLVDLLLHMGAAVGLFLLSRAIAGEWGGWCAGFLFGLHPALSEAVLSGVGRAELLAFCTGLVGVWSWKRSARRRGWLLLGGLSLLAAQLAKESGICFALVLGVCGLMGKPRNALRWVVPLLAAGTGTAIKWLVTGSLRPFFIPFIDNPLAFAEAPIRVVNGIRLLVKYLLLLVHPWPLSADYSYDQIPLVGQWQSAEAWVAILFLVSLGLLGAIQAWKKADFLIWGGMSAAALLMVSHILLPIGTLFAERLVYLPAAGFCLGVGWGLTRLKGRRAIWVTAVWGVVGGCLIRQRATDWQDDLQLFTRNVEVAGRSARSYYGLGRALQEREAWEAALEAYDQALRIYPRYSDAHFNRGTALLQLGKSHPALEAFRTAVDSRPGYIEALYACALLEENLGMGDAAEERYRELLRWRPDHLAGRKGLNRLLGNRARLLMRGNGSPEN